MALADTVRESAAPAVRQLQELGLRCVLMTGDNEVTARAVASSLGITEVVSGALPADKVAVIRRLQGEGRTVAMVGDGVNDGPALVVADLGLAVGSGTDVAINAADLIVMRDDLRAVATAIDLARRTLRTIHGNLAWACVYNATAIPLAALGFLNPLVAAGSHGALLGLCRVEQLPPATRHPLRLCLGARHACPVPRGGGRPSVAQAEARQRRSNGSRQVRGAMRSRMASGPHEPGS